MSLASGTKPVVLITGASRGLGLAVTRILLEQFDAIVIALSRTRTPEISELNSRFISRLLFISCDITDASSLTGAISIAIKTYGHIDSIILNAGTLSPIERIAGTNPQQSLTALLDSWRSSMELNLIANVGLLHLVTPYLISSRSPAGPKVIFVSSGAAVNNTAAWGAYNASKAALNSLCRTYANEQPTITSVAIAPGMVDTDMQAQVRADQARAMAASEWERFSKAHKDQALLDPSKPGYVIARLALEANKSLTGKFVRWNDDDCKPYHPTD